VRHQVPQDRKRLAVKLQLFGALPHPLASDVEPERREQPDVGTAIVGFPTKKPVTAHGLDIMVVKDGKLASGSTYSNSLELLGQEGPLPKPEADGDNKAAARKETKPASDKK
jgi:hypothetical protein